VKEDIIFRHIRAKFRVQVIFRSRDIGSNGGQNGSKMGFSWFSQKLGNRFGSIFSWRKISSFYIFVPSFEPLVTPKRLFRLFLENFSLDFANFLSEWGPYGPSSVCQVWSPGKIWFSRYGAICDPEKAPKKLFRLFLKNFSLDFANFLPEWGSYCTRRVCKVWRPAKIWFSRYGANRGQNGVKMEFFEISSKSLH